MATTRHLQAPDSMRPGKLKLHHSEPTVTLSPASPRPKFRPAKVPKTPVATRPPREPIVISSPESSPDPPRPTRRILPVLLPAKPGSIVHPVSSAHSNTTVTSSRPIVSGGGTFSEDASTLSGDDSSKLCDVLADLDTMPLPKLLHLCVENAKRVQGHGIATIDAHEDPLKDLSSHLDAGLLLLERQKQIINAIMKTQRFARDRMFEPTLMMPLSSGDTSASTSNNLESYSERAASADALSVNARTVSFTNEDLSSLLNTRFKLPSFRPNQLQAITSSLTGKDTIVLMPTGGGKSLCFQLPAVYTSLRQSSMTVVVCPLISLITDQVNFLLSLGIDVECLKSQQETSAKIQKRIAIGNLPALLYLSPEMLELNSSLLASLDKLYDVHRISLFVIDEAHCITTWGADFRPAYRNLGHLRERYSNVPFMAVTATATHSTLKDISESLNLRADCQIIRESFNRPNLFYKVQPRPSKGLMVEVVKWIQDRHSHHTGIIYCHGKEGCEKAAISLREQGLNARHYHADLSSAEKIQVHEAWKSGECEIVVATIAFGMGIDHAHVRFIIHLDLPRSLEAYYQETGRAGRDGDPADCLMYYSFKGFSVHLNHIHGSSQTMEGRQEQQVQLSKVLAFCGNDATCRRTQVLSHFGEHFDSNDCLMGCDNCSTPGQLSTRDVSTICQRIVKVVGWLVKNQPNVNISSLRYIVLGSGSVSKDVPTKLLRTCPWFNVPGTSKALLDRLIPELVCLGGLVFKGVKQNTRQAWYISYVMLGSRAQQLLQPETHIRIPSKEPLASAPANQHDEPPSAFYEDDVNDPEAEDLSHISPQKFCVNTSPRSASPLSPNLQEDTFFVDDSDGDVPNAASPKVFGGLPGDLLFLVLRAVREKHRMPRDVVSDSVLALVSRAKPKDYYTFRSAVHGWLTVEHDELYRPALLSACIAFQSGVMIASDSS